MKFHSVRGRLKLKGYRETERERDREVFMQVNVKELFNSLVTLCCITSDRYQYEMSNIKMYLNLCTVKRVCVCVCVCVYVCAQSRSTDIHDSAGSSFHSTLLMAPEQQLLKLLQAHVHILHGIRHLHSAHTHTHTNTHNNIICM